MVFLRLATAVLILLALGAGVSAKPLHHYVFFGQGRERLREAKSFLDSKVFEGAQVAYSWKQLEQGEDGYNFSIIRDDLALLSANGKKLFVQLQDVTFSPKRINVPDYLLRNPKYNGGADKQYRYKDGDEDNAVVLGWMARRWDPAVQERLHKLMMALGKEFDGKIEGINLAETAGSFGQTGKLFPKGFTHEIYRDAIISNMKVLKRAFPKSVALQYANFMPGGREYLRAVYAAAKTSKVGVGGPDLLPFRPFQLSNSYPLIREAARTVPVGIAVQDGNYGDPNPRTGKPATIAELITFATEDLKVDYLFWCTEEPYYSSDLVPFLSAKAK